MYHCTTLPLISRIQNAHTRRSQLSHRVHNIVVSPDLPKHVLFVGTRGEVTISNTQLDAESQQTYTPTAYPENARTLKSFVFSRRTASFAPTKTAPKQGVLIIIVSHSGAAGSLQVLAVDESSTIVPLGELPLPVQKSVSTECIVDIFVVLTVHRILWTCHAVRMGV